MPLRWSPDSTKLGYATYEGGEYRINLIDRYPSWSPVASD